MTSNNDAALMARALRLAERGRYSTHPNPCIGCVIVKDGNIVAEAWHRRTGEPHAEILALGQAGDAARGATVFVNLEPCCHHGRTPPCAGALIDAGVSKVFAAMEDPNPQVAGGGVEYLRGGGVDVHVGLLAAQAERLNRGFLKRMREGRPWVIVKTAASMDGRTATRVGESQWITGEAARADVHRMRARSSAIVTGSGTVLADDPLLTARMEGLERQPLRVVADSRLRTPVDAALLGAPGSTVIATAVEDEPSWRSLEAAGAELVCLPDANGRVDLDALLQHLCEREVNEVLVEAGPGLAGAMLQARLVDELVTYLAPVLLGDAGRGMFHLPGLDRLQDHLALEIQDVRAIGADLRLTLHCAG